jgi:hypothetical protein
MRAVNPKDEVGKTRRDKIRNTYINGELKMEEIQKQNRGKSIEIVWNVKKWMSIEHQKDY